MSAMEISSAARLGRSFRLHLCFSPSGKRTRDLLNVSGVVEIVRHYHPVVLWIETVVWFGLKAQSFSLVLLMSEIEGISTANA